jgi:tryptophan halogenase
MDSGWCWRIDLRDRVNRGYVFAASFCDVDSAIAEMRAKNPAMEDEVRTINFRSGRHERFWVRNVAAVGNASGFVEPLESTGLHMIADTARCLCEALVDSDCRPTNGIKAVANAVVAQRWDDIRNFLSIHFKFNNRLDTPFWLHCRAHTNIGDAERIVDFYKANGPSPFGFALLPHSSIFGIGGYLTMLLGQQVPSDYHNACECDEEEKWRLLVRRVDEFARAALPMDQALDALLDDDLEWSWGSCNTPCFDAYAAATGDS